MQVFFCHLLCGGYLYVSSVILDVLDNCIFLNVLNRINVFWG